MDSQTVRLLRSYSRTTGKPISIVKREWLLTPSSKRGDVRVAMECGLWSCELRDWRKENGLIQKEAWMALGIPEDTYRGWEAMKSTPDKYCMAAVRRMMQMIHAAQKQPRANYS